jgi:TM2 domain-containing membrane protein YozV
MDALETQMLIERSKVKSPGFAAVLGFFLPWAAAFYNGKTIPGLFLLAIDVVFFVLIVVGIGVPCLFLYGLWAGYQNYKWAVATNRSVLERMVVEQKKIESSKTT